MTKEIMQQALDALDNHSGNYMLTPTECDVHEAAINALSEAIAQTVQPAEPICPLCMRRPVFVFDRRVREWGGECLPCGIVGPVAFTEMDAIKNWMHRYQETVTTQPAAPPPHVAGDVSDLGHIANNLFVEERGDGIWLVCVEKVHLTREQARIACKSWEAKARTSVPVDMREAVGRFLGWPVPADCYPDGTPGQPGRSGTNLLHAGQAREMLEHVLQTQPVQPPESSLEILSLMAKHREQNEKLAVLKAALQKIADADAGESGDYYIDIANKAVNGGAA